MASTGLATLAMSPLVRSDGVRKRSGKEKNEIKGGGKKAEIKQNIVDEFRNVKWFCGIKNIYRKKVLPKFSLKHSKTKKCFFKFKFAMYIYVRIFIWKILLFPNSLEYTHILLR